MTTITITATSEKMYVSQINLKMEVYIREASLPETQKVYLKSQLIAKTIQALQIFTDCAAYEITES